MGRSYSPDLRVRIYGEIEQGGSRRAAARRFDVSASTSVRLAQRMAATGTLEPARQGRPPGVTVAWRGADGSEKRLRVEGDEPVLLELPPGTPHAARGEGPRPAYLVSWADGVPETEEVSMLL